MDNNNFSNDINELFNWINDYNVFQPIKPTNVVIKEEKKDEEIKNDKNDNNDDIINKKGKIMRCNICKIKIKATDEIISKCKCNKSHCLKHRLPEKHECEKIDDIITEQKNILKNNLVKLDSTYKHVKI